MKRFNPEEFYSTQLNSHFHEDINLKKPGIELIAQYLNHKYNTKITCSSCFLTCVQTIIQLSNLKLSQTHYRHAFIVPYKTDHSVFIAYIKENNREVLMYSDAKGCDGKLATHLTETTGMPLYASQEERLSTGYLSHIDALVFARDVTRINTNTMLYYMPNLIEALASKTLVCGGYKGFRMPNKLLKTTQLSHLISTEQNTRLTSEKVHKNETLTQFRARYSYDGEPTYLQEKGIKYAAILQIQFYINAIEKELARTLSQEIKHKFIIGAKNTFVSHPTLHTFAANFLLLLSQPSIESIPSELLFNSIFYKKTPEQAHTTLSSCTIF